MSFPNIIWLLLFQLLFFEETFGKGSRKRPTCTAPAIQNGAAKLKKRGSKIRYKCYRSYSIVGPRQARCISGNQWSPPEVPICVSNGCEEHEEMEIRSETELHIFDGFSVPVGSMLRYACNPGYDLIGDQVIWCDGILWNSSAPMCQRPMQPSRISCNFDDVDVDPWCGFTQSQDDDFEWILTEGSTPTKNTGPLEAYEGNKYVLVEASLKAENESARLISPVYNSSQSNNACIKIVFHMHGVDMGTLTISQFQEEDITSVQVLKEFDGNFEEGWNVAVLDIIPVEENFQYLLEGRVGSSYLSDIAVDSLELAQNKRCEELKKSEALKRQIVGRQSSPSSCWSRCDINSSIVAAQRG